MGINFVNAAMLFHEQAHRPITGKLVTIGRHSVDVPPHQLEELFEFYKIPRLADPVFDADDGTVGVEQKTMTQEAFFATFTEAEVLSLDVSAYENAAIVHDMQLPLPDDLYSIADFIYNGSCLDNIFDVAETMRNISKMLKPGGRSYGFEQANSHPTAYLKFSADWFMDFYAINQYRDCKTYIVSCPNTLGVPLLGPMRGGRPLLRSAYDIIVYNFNPYVEHAGGSGYDCSSVELFHRYEVHIIAEKDLTSTDDRNPIQKHYRVDEEHIDICLNSARRFLLSDRPVFRFHKAFDPKIMPRIDSSDYPEQIRPVAVIC